MNDQDTSARTNRRSRLLGMLTLTLLASWLLRFAPLPFSLLSGLAGLIALVLLIPLIVAAFRDGKRGLAVFTALIGIPATLMIVTSTFVTLLFYGPMSQFEQCRAAAITERAVAACTAQMQQDGAAWLSDLFGG